jgi:DNA/RNA-binding domain of Phe-tRNA-synthetase-like protein
MIRVSNQIPRDDVGLGCVRADGVSTAITVPAFEQRLAALLQARQAPLAEAEDAVRRAARDVLRNGRYKPTGRGKPASEYLLRAASRTAEEPDAFPRINAPVDVCNYISLKYLVPVSLWDLDRAEVATFVFRLGRADEAYVFNTADQVIQLEDLIVGCRVRDGAAGGEPIVNPVKDSMVTKTTPGTTRVAACVYAPLAQVSAAQLAELCTEFAEHLAATGPSVEVAYSVVLPGEEQSC